MFLKYAQVNCICQCGYEILCGYPRILISGPFLVESIMRLCYHEYKNGGLWDRGQKT